MADKSLLVKHLMHRAGFGPRVTEWHSMQHLPAPKLARQLLRLSVKWTPLESEEKAPLRLSDMQDMSKEEREAYVVSRRLEVARLNFRWVNQMAWSTQQVREKLTFFWHDHFACRVLFAGPNEQNNNVLRRHALGHFGDLLTAVARDPAMLRFLNNQQNRKAHPNENFARELLELFTLGRGNYTEKDIQEAARAFTGWSANLKGEFEFQARFHDDGSKTFLGQTGNFGGEDVIRIILEQKQCARFLVEKFYRYYVNPVPESEIVEQWAAAFYASNYHVGQLLETIFTSDHFYQSRHIGARIKSPIEFLVGLMRQMNLDFEGPEGPIFIQRALGQVLFQPPNVAGWPDGFAWIDSSSLLARMQLPRAMAQQVAWDYQEKDAFAGNEDQVMNGGKALIKKIKATLDPEPLRQLLRGKDPKTATALAFDFFIQKPGGLISAESIYKQLSSQPGSGLDDLVVALTSTPEYQFC